HRRAESVWRVGRRSARVRQEARTRSEARRSALEDRLVRSADAGDVRRRSCAGDAGAHGSLGARLRQLGDLRHGLLSSLRPDAARVSQDQAVEQPPRGIREARGLRAPGQRGAARQERARRAVSRHPAVDRARGDRRAQLREEGRELGAPGCRPAQQDAPRSLGRPRANAGRLRVAGRPLGREGRPQGVDGSSSPSPPQAIRSLVAMTLAIRETVVSAILDSLGRGGLLPLDDVRVALEREIDAAGPDALVSLKVRLGADEGWTYYPPDPLARRIHHMLADRFLQGGSTVEGLEQLDGIGPRPLTIFANHLSYADANVVDVLLERAGAGGLAGRLTAIAG